MLEKHTCMNYFLSGSDPERRCRDRLCFVTCEKRSAEKRLQVALLRSVTDYVAFTKSRFKSAPQVYVFYQRSRN